MGEDARTGLRRFLTVEQIAALPDQRGVRSWAFELYLELDHDDANVALGPVLHRLRDSWMQSFDRKPNPQRQKSFINCLRVILHEPHAGADSGRHADRGYSERKGTAGQGNLGGPFRRMLS